MSKGTPSEHRQMVKLLERRLVLLGELVAEGARSPASRRALTAERKALDWALPWLWLVVHVEQAVTAVTKHRPDKS